MTAGETLTAIVAGLSSPWPGGSAQRKEWEEVLLARLRAAALIEPLENYGANLTDPMPLIEVLDMIGTFAARQLMGLGPVPPAVAWMAAPGHRTELSAEQMTPKPGDGPYVHIDPDAPQEADRG